MPGYFDGQRYVTGPEAEGRQRPFDRRRRDRMAVARDLVRFGSPQEGIADAAGEEPDLLKAAARQMMALTENGADPEAISARLAEDRAAFEVDEAEEPYANAELVGQLAADVDDRTLEIRAEREADERQQAFEDWLDDTFDIEAIEDHIADLDPEDQQGFVDALVDRFEAATGFDPSLIATDDLEREHEPYSLAPEPGEPDYGRPD